MAHKKLNKQQIFDKVWIHFVEKGQPFAVENNQCRLLCSDGRKCAVGLLIPKSLYHPWMENSYLTWLLNSLKPVLMEDVTVEFLHKLRNIHDKCAIPGQGHDIKLELENFAQREGLTIP
jgi:hypothetical protein